nr:hypothetical protein [uncultured Chitinophaga sp.]
MHIAISAAVRAWLILPAAPALKHHRPGTSPADFYIAGSGPVRLAGRLVAEKRSDRQGAGSSLFIPVLNRPLSLFSGFITGSSAEPTKQESKPPSPEKQRSALGTNVINRLFPR